AGTNGGAGTAAGGSNDGGAGSSTAGTTGGAGAGGTSSGVSGAGRGGGVAGGAAGGRGGGVVASGGAAGVPSTTAPGVFSPPSQTFQGDLQVSLTTASANEIRYTVDGTPPTTSSTLYAGTPVHVTATTQIRAQT